MFIRRTLAAACRALPLALAATCFFLPVAGLRAGTDDDSATDSKDKTKDVPQAVLDEKVPLDEIDVEGIYVGQSAFRIKRFDGTGAQSQVPYESISETDLSLGYGHRFHLFGKVYLKVGAEYERLDFSTTTAPIPTDLQSLNGLVSLEYVEQGEVGAFIRATPGVYYSNFDQIKSGNFNVPFQLGVILPIVKNKVYFLIGAEANFLAKYPVLPLPGLVIVFNKHLRIMGTPPDPKLIYSLDDQLDFFVGAEISGDSYKRDYNPDYRPQDQRFSGAVVDYSETRVGGGVTYTPVKKLDMDIDFAGGWDLGQDFDFYRGQSTKRFDTKGAPYARISLSAKF